MALRDFEVDCTRLDKRTVVPPTGGVMIIWSDGAKFRAAIDTAVSGEAKIAFQTTGKELYTIMVDRKVGAALSRGSYFRNESTGAYIRVTNTGVEAPEASSISVRQFQGELVGYDRGDLPK